MNHERNLWPYEYPVYSYRPQTEFMMRKFQIEWRLQNIRATEHPNEKGKQTKIRAQQVEKTCIATVSLTLRFYSVLSCGMGERVI